MFQFFFGVVSVGNKHVCVTGCFSENVARIVYSCCPLSVFCSIVAPFEDCALLNMLRCIFCGYCEDACPTEAITLEQDFELSFYDREGAIYTKEMLIVDVPVNGRSTPQAVEAGAFDRAIPDMADPD